MSEPAAFQKKPPRTIRSSRRPAGPLGPPQKPAKQDFAGKRRNDGAQREKPGVTAGLFEWSAVHSDAVEQVMGVEPTSSAWKADVLAVVRHLQGAVPGALPAGCCALLYPPARRLVKAYGRPGGAEARRLSLKSGKQ